MSSSTRASPAGPAGPTTLVPPARRPLALAVVAACAAGFALLVVWQQVVGALPGELRLLRHRIEPGSELDRQWWHLSELLSAAGTPVPAALLLLLVGWAVLRRLGRRAAVFLVIATLGTLSAGFLKALIGPSPVAEIRETFHGAASFPSGHVTWTVTFFGALLLLAVRRRAPELAVAAVLVIGLMGPSRATIGAHALSEVLAGYLLGLGWTLAAALAVDRWAERHPAGGRPAGGGMPATPSG